MFYYTVYVELLSESGKVYKETHKNMSINDFEVLCGKWTDEVLFLQARKQKGYE